MADKTTPIKTYASGGYQESPAKVHDNADGTYSKTVYVTGGSSAPLPTGAARDGTDITTPIAMPAGGVGIRGWLSAIWTKINGSLAVTGTFWQTTQPSSDSGPSWTSSRGLLGLPFTSADQHSAAASVTDAPASGQKLCITDLVISVDTQMSVTFKEETSGTIVAGPYYLPAYTVIQITQRGKLKLPTADRKLQVLTSIAGNIVVSAYYYSEL